MAPALLQRVLARAAPQVTLRVDGAEVAAYAGESLLVAMLAAGTTLRRHEADGAPRAGFCLMGACQDCWVWGADGSRLRACTTPVAAGMEVLTAPPNALADG